jgi:hypothetical protein
MIQQKGFKIDCCQLRPVTEGPYMKRLFLVFLLICITCVSSAYAGSITKDSDWLWNYYGDVTGLGKVAITLVFQKENEITGVFYRYGDFVDFEIHGKLSDTRFLTFSIQDKAGLEIAIVRGMFVEQDPRGAYGKDTKLEFEVLAGTYTDGQSGHSMPLYLRLNSGTFGSIDHRYRIAGADDDKKINQNALIIWRAIQTSSAEQIANLVEYPISISIGNKEMTIASESEFIGHFNAIITEKLKNKLSLAFPHNMFVRYDGIMIGDGEIWLNSSGKIIAIQGQ